MEKIHLSVIIPAYNEEKRIIKTLYDIDQYLSRAKYPYEILVVNDGSKDKTADVVNELKKKISHLKLIDNNKNHGKGFVVKQGMLKAQGEYELFMDADNATSIQHLDHFWPYFRKGFDIVIASIEIPGSKIIENAGWCRRKFSKLAKYLIRAVSIWEIHDSQRGFKCFTAIAAQNTFTKQSIYGYGFDIEILIIAKKMGFHVQEVPVTWKNSGESKVTFMSFLRTFIELIQIKYNFFIRKYNSN